MFERFSEPARPGDRRGSGGGPLAPPLIHRAAAPAAGLGELRAVGAVSEARVTEEVVAALGPPARGARGQIPFTLPAQRCLERYLHVPGS